MVETVLETVQATRDYGRVAVIMGGRSAERDISLLSGNAVLRALQRAGVQAFGIDADRDLLQRLRAERAERAVIMLHGRDGEDGKLQGALDWLGLPYTGSGVLASALAMDKIRTKLLWQQLQLATPDFVQLRPDSDFAAVIDKLGPCFVKPVREGSSLGIGSAETAAQLEAAFHQAYRYDSEVLAECWIKGREYTVAILGEEVLPVVEMATNNAFYDYEAKYLSASTQYRCPAALDADASRALQDLALAAYRAVACRGWGRVDALRDDAGRFWLLEVNTVPGMTDHSLVPMAAKAAGYSIEALVLRILDQSLAEVNDG